MAPVVFVTRPLPDPGVTALEEAGLEVRVNPVDRPLARADLLAGVAEADALLCMLSEPVDAELLDAGPRLKVVSNYAVGFDNIDVAEARGRGIEVTTTPDVLTEATADLAWALLLAAARRIGEGDRLVRAGLWDGWGPNQLIGQPVAGRTIGIVGMGAIGRAVARRARGFSMPVVYFNRNRLPASVEMELGARYVGLDELLVAADVVSLHAPLNDESRHLLDADALRRMKPTAVLVNTGRGALIDEAGARGRPAGGPDRGGRARRVRAGARLGRRLAALENVVLAPHLGSADTEARAAMVRLCADNIANVLAGRPALTPAPGPPLTAP